MSALYRVSLWIMILLLLVSGEAVSQIPNAGFETWAGGNPAGWGVSNDPPGNFFNVFQSTNAHGGSSAVRGIVVLVETYPIQPVLQSGLEGVGFAHNQRSTNFTGYYQFYPLGGDKFSINVVLFNGGENGSAVAFAAAALPASVPTYTAFSVPFNYVSQSTPDWCVVQIMIIGPTVGNDQHAGSYFILDDIALTGTVGVAEQQIRLPAETKLTANYPNPFNPSTTIGYQLAASGFVTLTVHDVLGREVANLVNGMKEAGSHTEVWDARKQASGVYYCRLTMGGYTETRKLVLAK